MNPRYCTTCGKKLEMYQRFIVNEPPKFDAYTGKEIKRPALQRTILRCPDYIEEYSDQVWHVHDSVALDEIID